MPINIQYGPPAQLIGGAANLGGLGQWQLEQQKMAQQQAAQQQQAMAQAASETNRYNLAQQQMAAQGRADYDRAYLQNQQQQMDWAKAQQQAAFNWAQGQSNELQRIYQTQQQAITQQQGQGLQYLGQRSHEAAQFGLQEQGFQNQQDLLTFKQKQQSAEIDEAMNFVEQQRALGEEGGGWSPQQADQAMWELTQRKAGVRVPRKEPPPSPEQIAKQRMGQMPDGSMFVIQPDGKIEFPKLQAQQQAEKEALAAKKEQGQEQKDVVKQQETERKEAAKAAETAQRQAWQETQKLEQKKEPLLTTLEEAKQRLGQVDALSADYPQAVQEYEAAAAAVDRINERLAAVAERAAKATAPPQGQPDPAGPQGQGQLPPQQAPQAGAAFLQQAQQLQQSNPQLAGLLQEAGTILQRYPDISQAPENVQRAMVSLRRAIGQGGQSQGSSAVRDVPEQQPAPQRQPVQPWQENRTPRDLVSRATDFTAENRTPRDLGSRATDMRLPPDQNELDRRSGARLPDFTGQRQQAPRTLQEIKQMDRDLRDRYGPDMSKWPQEAIDQLTIIRNRWAELPDEE